MKYEVRKTNPDAAPITARAERACASGRLLLEAIVVLLLFGVFSVIVFHKHGRQLVHKILTASRSFQALSLSH